MSDDLIVWLRTQVHEEAVRGASAMTQAEARLVRALVALHTCRCPDPDCRDCGECSGAHHADPTPLPCDTIRVLAWHYADRPGYREEWRPV